MGYYAIIYGMMYRITVFVRANFRFVPESGNPRSVNYLFSGIFLTFPESGNPRSANYLFPGLFPSFWRDLLSFVEFLKGFAVIRRIIDGICCLSPNY